jgi:2-polyprenyl-3-methyl-5-hydroxy-6-metoxy-1,4-benzoquinol methylase
MKISEGMLEDGIVVGNAYDKYGSKNPIVRWIMKGFANSLSELVAKAAPSTIHELGCGEGYWVLDWNQQGIEARGSDFSEKVIGLARENASSRGVSSALFSARSIYDIEPGKDSADLVVCCEVLEHLDDPEAGLEALKRVATDYVILSVPREPIWCMLNLLRGKYLASFGNTPGHIQHWSSSEFVALVSRYFEIIEVKKPLPWTMLLCRVRQRG